MDSHNINSQMSYTQVFLASLSQVVSELSAADIDAVAETLAEVKATGGRLFLAGSGGGAGHASHATADFRKLTGIEAYCVTDNVSELTARINDDGWATAYSRWLDASRFSAKDALMIFSVGGGDSERMISQNLVEAMDFAKSRGGRVVGVAGRNGGHLGTVADAWVRIPTANDALLTAQVEGFQAVVWHMLVCHPALDPNTPKWESVLPQ